MTAGRGTVELFLQCAEVVATALADPGVAAAWDLPSVLEEQQVSGLAGHLARGGVWVVGDYLDGGTPTGPALFGSAGEYFAAIMGRSTADEHRAIRARGADVGSVGPDELARLVRVRLDALAPRLRALRDDTLIAVIAGVVLRLDDYLTTRLVEQVVHVDDLARSIGVEPWPLPPEAREVVEAVALDIARLRAGRDALLRALYRGGFAGAVFPVL